MRENTLEALSFPIADIGFLTIENSLLKVVSCHFAVSKKICNFAHMSYNDISAITDPLEAIKALFDELTAVKGELSSSRSDIARLNRNNTRLNVTVKRVTQERDAFKKKAEALEVELQRLGGKYVEKDSSNSDTPPTKQSIKKQIVLRTRSLREPSGKKPGGQEGHEGHSISKTQTPDGVEEHKVKVCPHCGCAIPDDAEQTCVKSIQVIDITGPMSLPCVTEHKVYSTICPHCHKTAKGDNPTGNCKKVMYGAKLQTLVVYLSVVQSIPYNRIQEIVKDIFMVSSFSEGSIKNILKKNKQKATPVYDSILDYIEKQKAAGMDETGAYINKKLCWFWCLQCPKFCYVFADESRGMQALEDHDIVKRLTGLILYTDRHGTYFKLQVAGHQVCLVHLVRNLQFLNDLNPKQTWSSGIQKLLREAMHKSKTMPLEQIDKEYYKKKLHEALDADLSNYEKNGKKYFQALQNGMINCEEYFFTFLEHEEVPYHNNSSEAAIRVLKVKTKVSGGFRTQDGADEFACFHSIAETAKRNNISKFTALYQLVSDMAPKSNFIENLISKES